MKLILTSDVKNVGKKDQIVDVNDGYAVNFLLPRHLAVKYDNKSLSVLNKQKEDRAKQLEEERQTALKNKELLKDITLEFTAKASPDGRMFGTISYKQIEQELKDKHNIIIDKRKFIDKYQINAFGFTRLKIELFKDVVGVVNVHVSEQK